MDASKREPMPVKGRVDILQLVIEDFKRRDAMGRRKYGTTLQSHNGRDAMMDLLQELEDAVMYLKQVMVERDMASEASNLAQVELSALNTIKDTPDGCNCPEGKETTKASGQTWQPISTMPQDGTLVLAWYGGENFDLVNNPPGHAIGRWERYNDCWIGEEIAVNFTHWINIPDVDSKSDVRRN